VPTKRKTARSPRPLAELPATLRGPYLLTVHNLNPGGGKEVRSFGTRASLLRHLADLLPEGRGPRVGAEEVYVITIVDPRRA
jgi:hypothetical protein